MARTSNPIKEAVGRLHEIGVSAPDSVLIACAAQTIAFVRAKATANAPLTAPDAPDPNDVSRSLRNCFDWNDGRRDDSWQVPAAAPLTAALAMSGLTGLRITGVHAASGDTVDDHAAKVVNELLYTIGGLEARRLHGLEADRLARGWAKNLQRALDQSTRLGKRNWARV